MSHSPYQIFQLVHNQELIVFYEPVIILCNVTSSISNVLVSSHSGTDTFLQTSMTSTVQNLAGDKEGKKSERGMAIFHFFLNLFASLQSTSLQSIK
jgi:hypothetical protein